MSKQYTMIFKDEIHQIRTLNSSGKHLFLTLCLHTKFQIKEEEGKQYRIRKCFPSYDRLMNLTGCSRGYVGKGIANLKENGFLTSQQRAGTTAIFTIKTEVYTVETSENESTPEVYTVETTENHTVETSENHTVETSEKHTVYKHIKNNEQKDLTETVNRLILTDKQKEIINKLSSYFGWKGKNYIEDLEKVLPADCYDYLTDELMLIGAYNLKRMKEGKGAWTGNYVVKGISYWLQNGKGKSSKPNVHTAMLVEEVHDKILQFKNQKEPKTEESYSDCESTEDGQEDFDWLLDHNIKQYTSYPSISNRTMIENMKTSPHCHDLNLQKIKTAIGE